MNMAKEKKEIVIEKTVLEKEHTFFPIEELPVKNTSMVQIEIAGTSWEDSICYLVLLHWEEIGCVALCGKEALINAIMDGRGDIKYERPEETCEKIKKSVEFLISQGIFKEEIENGEKWLIPLNPLLKCATPHPKEQGISWCFMPTYYNVSISLA